jgi:hypothetical protein
LLFFVRVLPRFHNKLCVSGQFLCARFSHLLINWISAWTLVLWWNSFRWAVKMKIRSLSSRALPMR